MKKIISMLITITLIAASTAFVFAEKGEVSQNEVGKIKEFTDLTKHWAKGYIDKLISLGTINGYEDGSFKPDNPIKVGEFTKILISSLGYKDGNSTEGHWSLNYVNKAKELGLMEEDEFSLTELDRNINRGEMARMIVRASKEEYPENIADYKEIIKDYKEIPKEYQAYVLKAFIKGIITGYKDSTFKYDKTATRAEASTMIIRLLDKEERKVPIEDSRDSEEQGNKDFIEPKFEVKPAKCSSDSYHCYLQLANKEEYQNSGDEYKMRFIVLTLNGEEHPEMNYPYGLSSIGWKHLDYTKWHDIDWRWNFYRFYTPEKTYDRGFWTKVGDVAEVKVVIRNETKDTEKEYIQKVVATEPLW